MLKIKDNRVHELVNYGFKRNDVGVYGKGYANSKGLECAILVNYLHCEVKNQIAFYVSQLCDVDCDAGDEVYDLDVIYDLIVNGMTEKVEG